MRKAKGADQVRDEVRELVRKSEQAFVEAGERWTETFRDLVPGDGARVRKIVDDAFDFTERVLKSQREFATSVLDAVLGEEAKPVAKPAPKRAAPKRPANKRGAKPKGKAAA